MDDATKQHEAVKKYLRELAWDGRERAPNWLSDFAGIRAEGNGDHEYVQEVGLRWLIQAVARVFQPGIQADGILTIGGPLALRKSAVLSTLGGNFYEDGSGFLDDGETDRTFAGALPCAWIWGLGDLTQHTRRAGWEHLKAFVSRRADVYRPPYAQRPVSQPRWCVFAATTCDKRALVEDLGAMRRFWAVHMMTRADLEGLQAARDQLWAEARVRFERGEGWTLQESPLALVREPEVEDDGRDPWEHELEEWASARDHATIAEAWNALGSASRRHSMSSSQERRLALVLRCLGFSQVRRDGPGHGRRIYCRPQAA